MSTHHHRILWFLLLLSCIYGYLSLYPELTAPERLELVKIRPRNSIMAPTLPDFCLSIGLSEEDSILVQSKLEGKPPTDTTQPNLLLDVCCLTARLLLGLEKVDLSPLNQTVVSENWHVLIPPCGSLTLTNLQVSNVCYRALLHYSTP